MCNCTVLLHLGYTVQRVPTPRTMSPYFVLRCTLSAKWNVDFLRVSISTDENVGKYNTYSTRWQMNTEHHCLIISIKKHRPLHSRFTLKKPFRTPNSREELPMPRQHSIVVREMLHLHMHMTAVSSYRSLWHSSAQD
jgi:hypothetical protein